jgi:hypothetical protein
MTGIERRPLHVTVTTGSDLEAAFHQGPDSESTPVVIVTAAERGLTDSELEQLATILARPQLISIGVAPARVSGSAAAILLACDFLICSPSSDWEGASSVVASAARTRLPASMAARVGRAGSTTATDLHRDGLVTELAEDPEHVAQELAAELATMVTEALSGAKQMIDTAQESDLDTALQLECELQVAALTSPEHQRIVARQLAARAATSTRAASPSQT